GPAERMQVPSPLPLHDVTLSGRRADAATGHGPTRAAGHRPRHTARVRVLAAGGHRRNGRGSGRGTIHRRGGGHHQVDSAPYRERGGNPMSESSERAADGTPLLRVDDVSKHFRVSGTGFLGKGAEYVHAVDGVSLDVREGETLGLVGETGCGKSTLARCITGLHQVSSGSITYDGVNLTRLSQRKLRPYRADIQMIFQDPYGSLNPRRRVGSIIGDPFVIHKNDTAQERKRRVQDLMQLVGLNPEHYNRFPSDFSGGQRQRIGIARALALRPRLIVCDEPIAALDVSIQAQVLNLLNELQDEFDLTYVFIAHDLAAVQHISDRVA